MEEKTFVPAPAHLTKEAIYTVIGVLLVGP